MLDEAVGYHDTFTLLNMKESTEYYIHAHLPSYSPLSLLDQDFDQNQEQINDRMSAVLEVNVSHEFTKWVAKKFLDFKDIEQETKYVYNSNII